MDAIWNGSSASTRRPGRLGSRLYDGVDYVPLPRWRIFLIQLLNIAGLGPIFGAVLGAAYGAGGVSVDHLRRHLHGCGA